MFNQFNKYLGGKLVLFGHFSQTLYKSIQKVTKQMGYQHTNYNYVNTS